MRWCRKDFEAQGPRTAIAPCPSPDLAFWRLSPFFHYVVVFYRAKCACFLTLSTPFLELFSPLFLFTIPFHPSLWTPYQGKHFKLYLYRPEPNVGSLFRPYHVTPIPFPRLPQLPFPPFFIRVQSRVFTFCTLFPLSHSPNWLKKRHQI